MDLIGLLSILQIKIIKIVHIIHTALLDHLTNLAKKSRRLRMNYNFHEGDESASQRLLNAMEPGTVLPVHRHLLTAETYVLLRGRIEVQFYNEEKEVVDTVILDPEIGNYGVNIPAGQWHSLEVLLSGSVIFEVKDGPYAPLSPKDIL